MKALQFSFSVPQFAALKVLGTVSKLLYYKGPLATVRVVDVPEPALPAADWVKIRTRVCGFCGSDTNAILLGESPSVTPFVSVPCTLGHEFSGEVVEVGSGVDGLRAGDRVTVAPHLNCSTRGIDPVCWSCQSGRPANCENFAEGTLSPGLFAGTCGDIGGGFAPSAVAHRSHVFKLPDEVSFEEGALIEPLACAVQAVIDNTPAEDDQVLVVGGGVIGSLIVQVIRAFDIPCSLTVVEPSRFHAELASKAGADHVVTPGEAFGHTKRVTGARSYKPVLGPDILMGGFSKVYDVVGSSATLNSSMRALRACGVLSVVGIGKEVKLDVTPLWLKLQTIKGVYAHGYTDVAGESKHVFEVAIDLVRRRKVDLASMVTHTFRLEEYKRMIEVNLNKAKHKAVKTVVAFP